MAFPWLLAALAGGGAVVDHQMGGHGRRAIADTVGDAWDAITGAEPDPNNPNSFIPGGHPTGGTNGNGNDNEGGGIMSWLGDNLGTVGPLGGILALQMSPLPDFVKKMGTIGLLVMAAINFFKGRMSNEFNTAGAEENGRHVVMEQGFDPNDPNIVAQSGPDHRGGPDVTAQHEELIATAE